MDDTTTTLLVAERDEPTRAFLLDNLAADGYQPLAAQTERETTLKLANHHPALLVLGRVATEHGTLALIRAVRAGEGSGDPAVPLIALGAPGGELELLRAFDAGADDFLARPFSYPELLARVRARIYRADELRPARRLRVGTLVIDRDARQAHHGGQPLWLSPLEFELLAQLAAEPARVFSRQELLRSVWRSAVNGPTRTVDTHACRLRRKLAQAGAPQLLHTCRGVGYRLTAEPQPASAPLLTLVEETDRAA